jgi:hypothetical protein
MLHKLLLLFGITFVLFGNTLSAQVVDGYHDKLADLYEEGRYLDCAFKADRMLMKDKYSKDPEVYLYLAICKHQIFLLSIQDPQIIVDNPDHKDAYEDALKHGATAKKRDKKVNEFFPNNDPLLEDIVYTGLPMCEQYIAEAKYSKASSLYRKFLKMIDNQHILFMKGVMDLYNQDEFNANEILTEVYSALKNKTITKNTKTEYLMPEGFILYHDFLMQEDSVYYADSAFHVMQFANRYYPNNPELLSRLKDRRIQTDK